MLERFMCQPGHAEILNFAPACQDMAVLDIGMAQVKPRSLDDHKAATEASPMPLSWSRSAAGARSTAESEPKRRINALARGLVSPRLFVARIEKYFQQFKLAERLASLVRQLGTHAAPMPGHVVGRAVGVRGIGSGGHHAQWDSPKGLK
ncbi:MAG: hypothetical protein VX425_08665, partial [Pseudomonadota bacterium]|nr:hypothetical protein [Pseudomonadota bacterium]